MSIRQVLREIAKAQSQVFFRILVMKSFFGLSAISPFFLFCKDLKNKHFDQLILENFETQKNAKRQLSFVYLG